MTTRRTGYHVWIYGECYWHRTERAAVARAENAERWASGQVQVIEVKTGRLIYGQPA